MLGASAGPLYEGNLARKERRVTPRPPVDRFRPPSPAGGGTVMPRRSAWAVQAVRARVPWDSLGVLAAFVVAGLILASLQAFSLHLGYRLQSLQVELQAVAQQNQNLALQVAELGSLGRIQQEATRLGMVQPAEVRVAVLPAPGAGGNRSAAARETDTASQGLAYAASHADDGKPGGLITALQRIWARLWPPGRVSPP